jgi:branched-chain amino acid transport system permease protein
MTDKSAAACVLACIAVLLLPLALGNFAVTLATEILIMGVFVLGVNLLLGFTGLVPLGNAMFLGAGAYGIAVFGKLLGWPLWIAVPATLVLTAAISLVIGAVCTRTRDVEFLLITLAFCQLFYGVAIKVKATGGSDGMAGISRPDLAFAGINMDEVITFYVYTCIVSVAMTAALWRIVHSPFGSVLAGIRENERRLIAMSYEVASYKIAAFVVSAVFAAVAGILTAQYTYFVNPEAMTWQVGGEAVLIAIIGGRRYLLGPIVGSAVFILVKHGLSVLTADYLIYFGLFFMLCVIFFKDGIVGQLDRWFRAWGDRASAAGADPNTASRTARPASDAQELKRVSEAVS